MEIESYLTPYKLGRPVLSPSGEAGTYNRYGVDCPQLFRHNGQVYMLHLGFNGERYETALSRALDDELTEWEDIAVVLPRGSEGAWDGNDRAGCSVICGEDLYGEREIEKINGKYWMFYHAYPGVGYESGPAEIGLAWCEDEELLIWHCLEKPVFSWRDGEDWERGGLYKCWVVRKDGLFYMFYNAKNITEGIWREQTGAAVSGDMLSWTRVKENPLVRVTRGGWDSVFASDPCVVHDERRGKWIMFYYGFNGRHAADGIAESDDLIHFTKYPEPVIAPGEPGSIDEGHAHKPGIIYHKGRLYHFYCACAPTRTPEEKEKFGGEFRCISVARSEKW